MKNIILTIGIILGTIGITKAQNDVDALRYSYIGFGGTAKSIGAGGAYGALGGDASCLSVNPAGIGIYRKSEFNFSANVLKGSTESSYLGTTREDMKYNFNFGNFSLIGAFKLDTARSKGWKYLNFGFGSNRLANFHNRIDIEGRNTQNSLSDQYVILANGNNFDNLDSYSTALAWNTYLIDTLPGTTNSFISAVPASDIKQRKLIETKGGINETYISLGGNYNNKLYIGGTFGFPSVRYVQESSYTENDDKDTINGFKSLTLNEHLKTTGSGINFKLGIIFRPVDWVRLGAAVHTPTFYTLHDEFSSKMTTTFDNGKSYSDESKGGSFDYELTTPMRAIGSIAFVIGKIGFISADYEVVNYTESQLRSKNYTFFDENDAIRQKYTSQSNLRIGGELNLKPFAVRAGYALYGSPYRTGINDASRTSYTFGFGYRDKDFYLDFAYVLTTSTEDYYLYSIVPEASKNKFSSNSLITTLGFRF
ncbi:MAG: hypothetical protein WCK02_06345 [Bacteroidota bacterium]